MKIIIAYIPNEESAARTVEKFARAVFPGTKVRKSDRHPPYLHTYITTENSKKSKDNA